MYLNQGMFPTGLTIEQAEQHIADHNAYMKEMVAAPPIPMRPLFLSSGGTWAMWCPNLHPVTGRCTDYDNRPDLCRDYEPGQDPLCIMHVPIWEEPEVE